MIWALVVGGALAVVLFVAFVVMIHREDAARGACAHPRAQRVFHADGRRQCGRCGAELERDAPTQGPRDG